MSKTASHMETEFLKMHGAGNDFIVLDRRGRDLALNPGAIRALADRRKGIGCDQVLVLERSSEADVRMRIFNADGSEAEQCGNGTRCLASLVMKEKQTKRVVIESASGLLKCHSVPGGVAIDMGKPEFDWRKIPLSEERDTLHLGLKTGALFDPVALSVGNPHAVYFVDKAEEIPLQTLGPKIETYFLFPERVNVSVAQVISSNQIRLRVWERGTGITLACGTAACAVLAAAHARGLSGRKAAILMDGGKLFVELDENDHMVLSGPAEIAFKGRVKLETGARKEHVA